MILCFLTSCLALIGAVSPAILKEPRCINGEWTQFFDRDDPTGSYDYEALSAIQIDYPGKVCPKPTAIDARLLSGAHYSMGGDSVVISPTQGLICKNADQKDKRCNDYKVRFCCPKYTEPVCENGEWTQFFDRDDPSGDYDYEKLSDIQEEYPGKVCSKPIGVDARLLNGSLYQTAGENVAVSPSIGLICKNSDQVDKRCEDYKVRFCCPREPVFECPDNAWTQWFDRDNPSGTGDHEVLVNLQQEYPGKICPSPSAIDARLLNGAQYSTSGEVVTVSPSNGLVCLNSAQKNKKCSDYKVRFCCFGESTCRKEDWTQWFDRDDPSGYYDWEGLTSIQQQYPGKVCSQPTAVDAQLTSGAPYTDGMDDVVISPTYGLTCKNADQSDKTCNDYKVRFCCSKNNEVPTCNGNWTQWFDRDNPSGYGDYETLSSLQEAYAGKICTYPTAIDARLLNGQPWQSAGQVVSVSPSTGLACVNSQNKGECKDYKVRFCCKEEEPVCADGGKWTQWFDRDNPGGYGDYETMAALQQDYPGKICDNPSAIDARLLDDQPWQAGGQTVSVSTSNGLACVNSQNEGGCKDYKVRFCCKPVEPVCDGGKWTQWFDRDNPSGYGDYETLNSLLKEYPGKLCAKPSAIDARLLNDDPWQSAGQAVSVNPTTGLACVNAQNGGKCLDYKVRFCCKPVEPECAGGKWTGWYDRDNPGGYGDYETLSHLQSEHPGEICPKPSAIDAMLVDGRPWYAEGQTVTLAPEYGLACVNSQNKGGCKDYKVRFCCKPVEPECPGGAWTQWFDRDNPSGGYDWETLESISKQYPGKVCASPSSIEAQLLNGAPYTDGGDIVQVSPSLGLICENAIQSDKRCNDYKVRFCCFGESTCRKEDWTQWFDRDNPSGYYDWEGLNSIQQQFPGKVCTQPTAIDAQLTSGADISTSNDVLVMNPTYGLTCENAAQPDKSCNDYRVRFCCPKTETPICPNNKWTQWFNRDSPSGYYDYESLSVLQRENPGKICASPSAIDAQLVKNGAPYQDGGDNVIVSRDIGLICENRIQPDRSCNDYKVRFCCAEDDVPVCKEENWTPWFDSQKPGRSNGLSDRESLADLRKLYPGRICNNPSAVDAQLATGAPYTSGGDVVSVGPLVGLICNGRDQRDQACNNYKVRFCCDGEESGGQNIDRETEQVAMETKVVVDAPVEKAPVEKRLSFRTRA